MTVTIKSEFIQGEDHYDWRYTTLDGQTITENSYRKDHTDLTPKEIEYFAKKVEILEDRLWQIQRLTRYDLP